MSEDPRPRAFQPIEDSREVLGYLGEGIKAFASALIWTKDQQTMLSSQLVFLDQIERSLYAQTPKEFRMSDLKDAFKRNGNQECYFSVSLPSANLFFKTQFLAHDPKRLKFQLPSIAYKVQRRDNVRFQIPTNHVLWVEFDHPCEPGQRIRRKIVDISAGGLSFNISEQEHQDFGKGFSLQGLKVVIQLKTIQAKGEVRYTKPLRDGDQIKVGVQFKGLAPTDVEIIASYVFEESRKYFLRFL